MKLTRAGLQIILRETRTLLRDRLERALFSGNEPAHVAGDKEVVRHAPDEPQGGFPFQLISHDRQTVFRFEFVRVAEPLECSFDHLIDETVGTIEGSNSGNEFLSDAKMTAFKGDQIVEFEEAVHPAGLDDALQGERGRFSMSVHVAGQIKAELYGRVDSCFDGDCTHGYMLFLGLEIQHSLELETFDLLKRLAGDALEISVHAHGGLHHAVDLLLALGPLARDRFLLAIEIFFHG